MPRSDMRILAQEPFLTYELAAQVPCPTLLLRGTASGQLNRIQFLLIAGALPDGSFQELAGLGHHFLVEDPTLPAACWSGSSSASAGVRPRLPDAAGFRALKILRRAAPV